MGKIIASDSKFENLRCVSSIIESLHRLKLWNDVEHTDEHLTEQLEKEMTIYNEQRKSSMLAYMQVKRSH